MQNKRLSFILMGMMFLVFFSMITAYLAFSNSADQKKIAELENNDKILNEKIESIKVQTDEWNQIINGTTEVELETEAKPETPAAPAEEPKAEAPAAETPAPAAPMTVKATNINLRSAPSSTGSVVRKIPMGEKVTPTGNKQQAEGYMWLEVTDTKGNKGWAAQNFLQ